DEERKEYGLKEGEGVLVGEAPVGGAANVAGLRKGDIVTKINGVSVTTGPEMVEQVTRYKPGDKVSVTYLRGGKENVVSLTLKNKAGNTSVVKNANIIERLGGELETLDKKSAATYDIPGGVVVKKIGSGILNKTKMQDGFVITSVNGTVVKNLDDLRATLEKNKGGTVKLEGIYPGYEGSYGYPLTLGEE
ncbi:MAG TPA: PDZ domain-containing protein, partial [Segetibacter sp.]